MQRLCQERAQRLPLNQEGVVAVDARHRLAGDRRARLNELRSQRGGLSGGEQLVGVDVDHERRGPHARDRRLGVARQRLRQVVVVHRRQLQFIGLRRKPVAELLALVLEVTLHRVAGVAAGGRTRLPRIEARLGAMVRGEDRAGQPDDGVRV